jgi:hypothetical protein
MAATRSNLYSMRLDSVPICSYASVYTLLTHHLDALALRRRYLPPQRSVQPPHLGFAAFVSLVCSGTRFTDNECIARVVPSQLRSSSPKA